MFILSAKRIWETTNFLSFVIVDTSSGIDFSLNSNLKSYDSEISNSIKTFLVLSHKLFPKQFYAPTRCRRGVHVLFDMQLHRQTPDFCKFLKCYLFPSPGRPHNRFRQASPTLRMEICAIGPNPEVGANCRVAQASRFADKRAKVHS